MNNELVINIWIIIIRANQFLNIDSYDIHFPGGTLHQVQGGPGSRRGVIWQGILDS